MSRFRFFGLFFVCFFLCFPPLCIDPLTDTVQPLSRWALTRAVAAAAGSEPPRAGQQVALALQLVRTLRQHVQHVHGPALQPMLAQITAELSSVDRVLAKHHTAHQEGHTGDTGHRDNKPFFEWKDGVLVKGKEFMLIFF